VIGESFAQGIAVVLFAELGQDGKDQAAAAQLEAEILKDGLDCFAHTVLYTLYDVQCVTSSINQDFLRLTVLIQSFALRSICLAPENVLR
jgi:hypothetical protein